MSIIDNRTVRLNLPLPNTSNNMTDDCARLIEALNTLDSAVALTTDLNSYVTTSTYNTGMASKADADAMTQALASKANTVDLANKADVSGSPLNVFNVAEASNASHAVTKSQLDAGLGTKLNAASYTAADVLSKVKSVDGASSGLDADLLDGYEGSRYSRSQVATFIGGDWNTLTTHGVYKIHTGSLSAANAPPAAYEYGILVVEVSEIDGENRTLQVYYPHSQDIDKYIYQRMYNAVSWTSWCKIWRGGTGPGSGLVAESINAETLTGSNVRDLVYAGMADNDFFRIRVGGDGSDAGWAEIATSDNGTEPIYVRQYYGVFSSLVRTLTLLDSDGNTRFPGRMIGAGYDINASGGGIYNGNADGCSQYGNNVAVRSWFGIGFAPTITGQPVPYGEYSHWFNVRNGNAAIRGSLTQYSDIRLKEDIAVIPDALAKIDALRGVTYARKDSGERATGVIAQEVQAVLPEAVRQEGDYLAVTYGNMVGLLIEGIKELKSELAAVKAELAEIKGA